jgi:1D-myo-inositol-tetrakisphosphate 5-kinase/inositol-polyphosphate multikinase
MPKAFGKAISSDDLPLGMRHFFGSSLASDAAAIDSILFSSSSSSSSSEEEQSPTRTRTSSLPRATMALLLQHGLLPRLTQLRAAVAAVEWRMRGGSVLIVYEGEAQRLVQNVARAQKEDKWEALCVKKPNSSAEDEARPEEQRGTRVDASAEEEKEKEEEEDSASDSSQIQPVFDVRLIDFAHVTFVAKGQGADEGVLLGLDSTIRLLRGLLQQLQLKLPQ